MLISIDESPVRGAAAVDRLVEIERAFARLHALQADTVVAAAEFDPVVEEFVIPDSWTDRERHVLIEEPIRDEIAAALRKSSVAVQGLIDASRLLAGPLRLTWECLNLGEISMAHARILLEAADRLPPDLLQAFQLRVLPRAKAGNLEATRRAARYAEHVLDREGTYRRRKREKCTRDVWVSHEPDGISTLFARLSTERALAMMVTITAHADAHASTGLLVGEKRADALFDLVMRGDDPAPNGSGGERARPRVRAHLNVTVPVATLLNMNNGPIDLDRVGTVSSEVLADLLADEDVELTFRRLVVDEVTGRLYDVGRRSYAIPRRLREFLTIRDRNCRFPGCHRRADLCQIDHATPWNQGGETSRTNNGPLCIRHHHGKTFLGWHIIDSRPDGSCTWKSPQGRLYEHEPPAIDPSG